MNSMTPLLRLPSEIRIQIWNYVVGGNYVLMNYHPRFMSRVTGPMSAQYLVDRRSRGTTHPLPTALPIFQFSRVCRQIYSETAMLAYSQNIFVVDHHFFWYNDSPVSHSISPVQREAITSVALIDGLIDDYFLDSRAYPYQSLRKYFINCKSFEVMDDLEGITDFEDWYVTPEDPKLDWREWVVWKLKQREGEDIEVTLGDEVDPDPEPWWWGEPQEFVEIGDEEQNDAEDEEQNDAEDEEQNDTESDD
jgi:hypothetical protein